MSTKKHSGASTSLLGQRVSDKENITPNGNSSLANNGKQALHAYAAAHHLPHPQHLHHYQHGSSTHSINQINGAHLLHHNPYMTDQQRGGGYYGYPPQINHPTSQHDNSLEVGGRISHPSHHRSFGQDLINPGVHGDSTGKPATSGQPNRVRLNTTRLHLDGMPHYPHVMTGANIKSSRNKSRDSLGPNPHNTSLNSGLNIYTRVPARKHIQIGAQSTKHSAHINHILEGNGGFASSRGSAMIHPPTIVQNQAINNSGARSHSASSFQKKSRAPSQSAQPPPSNHPNFVTQIAGQSAMAPPPSIGGPRRPSIRKVENIHARNRISIISGQASSRSGSMERSTGLQSSHRSSSAQQRILCSSGQNSEVKIKRKRLDQFYHSLEKEMQKDMLLCDYKDRRNPQLCGEYATQITQYIGEIETRFLPQHGYIRKQTDINQRMRAILIDWLVDVHLKFKLLPETLYLSVNMIDRYLSKEIISRRKLQLVGISAMLISSKYEEIYPPEIKDFTYITDRAYSKQDVLQMESQILAILEFNVTVPSCYRFLERFARLSNLEIAHFANAQGNGSTGLRTFMFARYLTELALVDYNMLRYTPRVVAAAAIYIALRLMKFNPPWNQNLVRASNMSEGQLKPCARQLMTILDGAEKANLKAIRKKYSQKKFMEVSKIKLDVQKTEDTF